MSDQININDKKEIDDHSGVETTGHSWDGIKELNNPLPRWWLIIWYITIVWAVIYMVLMPAIPALPGLGTNTTGVLGASDRDNIEDEMALVSLQRADQSRILLDASLEEIKNDRDLQQFSLAMGASLFGDNCSTCHGASGRGVKGYPSLADDVWLWDGTLDGIEYTLRHGIRHNADDETRLSYMPSFGRDEILSKAEIRDLTQYVLGLSGQEVNQQAVSKASLVYEQQCAACHGSEGKGNREIGAPNLTDREWLYGSDPETVYQTIYNARNSHMPAWDGRLDDTSIKALAVYVHSLGGGE